MARQRERPSCKLPFFDTSPVVLEFSSVPVKIKIEHVSTEVVVDAISRKKKHGYKIKVTDCNGKGFVYDFEDPFLIFGGREKLYGSEKIHIFISAIDEASKATVDSFNVFCSQYYPLATEKRCRAEFTRKKNFLKSKMGKIGVTRGIDLQRMKTEAMRLLDLQASSEKTSRKEDVSDALKKAVAEKEKFFKKMKAKPPEMPEKLKGGMDF